MSYIDPDRHLNPPEPKAREEREWSADFKCYIGQGGLEVNVLCDVSIADELVPDSLCISHKGIDITDILNRELREEIVCQFERNFEDIKDDCY